MKPDREEVLRMAREAGIPIQSVRAFNTGRESLMTIGSRQIDELERLVALAYEAGARAEEAKFRRGEYICPKCGLRQDATDQPEPSF